MNIYFTLSNYCEILQYVLKANEAVMWLYHLISHDSFYYIVIKKCSSKYTTSCVRINNGKNHTYAACNIHRWTSFYYACAICIFKRLLNINLSRHSNRWLAWECEWQSNNSCLYDGHSEMLTFAQHLQNYAAWLKLVNFETLTASKLARSVKKTSIRILKRDPGWYTIKESRDFFLATWMFKTPHA